MILEWRNDGGMRGFPKSWFLVDIKTTLIPPRSAIPSPFSNDKEWKLQWRDTIQDAFQSFSLHSSLYRHLWMMLEWRNEVRWREIFKTRQNPLFWNLSHSATFRHSVWISFSSYDHSIHLRVSSSFQPHSSSRSISKSSHADAIQLSRLKTR